jgi:outer membrane protein OmpA-like peptidoglycan-associated protein
MRIANNYLFVLTIFAVSVTAAFAQVPETAPSSVMSQQHQAMWEAIPYSTDMMPYYLPNNTGFNTEAFPAFPMLQNMPIWGDMPTYPMGNGVVPPYYMFYPANVEQQGANSSVTATTRSSLDKAPPSNGFIPLDGLPSQSSGLADTSEPLYSAPYYMPMLIPDSFDAPRASAPSQFLSSGFDDHQALAESAQLISKLKQTISDSITVLTKTSNDRDMLLKRIAELEENMQRSKAQFVALTGNNDVMLSTKNQLLGKAKSTIEGNITTMQHFLTSNQQQNSQFSALQQQFQQQQQQYGTTNTNNEALIQTKNQLLGKAKETLKNNIATMQRFTGEYDQLTTSLSDLNAQVASKKQDNSALQHKIQAFAGLSQQLSGATADDDKDGVVNPSDQCPNTPTGTYVDAKGCLADIDHDGITDDKDKCAFTNTNIVVNETGCEKDSDKDGVIDSQDQCPASTQGITVLATGCEEDTDKDDVANSKDQCPDTPADSVVDAKGCELDTDNDAILDSQDKCPNTAQGITVNATGCEIDTDNDGLVDSKDQCDNTKQGITIDAKGCEIDTDNDGVVDSKDQCPSTNNGTSVDPSGCGLDTDKDGVTDKSDQCPETEKGVNVNPQGCALDSDNDGIADIKDQCPATANGIKTDDNGCELDSDADEIVNSKDQCPNSSQKAIVDDKGCEADTDNDKIVDSQDQCPATIEGNKVDKTGCELDSDQDGVVDSKDACNTTVEGANVDTKGCELDADSDGIADDKDQCENTATDITVDAKGCELDSDNDGVLDSKDQCKDTPNGAIIDKTTGCEPDADNDGVSDTNDLCPSTASGIKTNRVGCSANENMTLKGVNFKTGSAELTAASLPLLNDAAGALKRHPDITIEVGGHTDSVGGAKTNKELSQKRAASVMEYLISKGIDSDKITAKGYGEEVPIANNRTENGRASNRRVELKITH